MGDDSSRVGVVVVVVVSRVSIFLVPSHLPRGLHISAHILCDLYKLTLGLCHCLCWSRWHQSDCACTGYTLLALLAQL